jgi:hypothetical protein
LRPIAAAGDAPDEHSFKGAHTMSATRILQVNALSTAVCAIGMLAARETLYGLFGLTSPVLLDELAVALLAYAGALLVVAGRQPVGRRALIAFSIADGVWVVGSGIVLLRFWPQLSPLARVLVFAVAVVVEVFATLQFRAAGALRRRSPQLA